MRTLWHPLSSPSRLPEPPESLEETYDPAEHNVDAVLEYMDEHPEQRDEVLAMERANRGRKGILGDGLMESAFGVDHGEIDKAFGVSALGSKIGGGATKLGQGLRRTGAGAMQQGRQMGGAYGAGLQAGGAARVR